MAQHAEIRRAKLLRPAGFDELGLRRALSDRILPALVAAMSFLAALALAGGVAAGSLASHWQAGAVNAVTVQVPRPMQSIGQPAGRAGGGADETRRSRVLALLQASPEIVSARVLPDEEMSNLLRPWLGAGIERLSLPLPAVIEVHLVSPRPDLEGLARRAEAIAPGTLVESHGVWLRRLSALANSLIACAAVAVIVVAMVAAAVVAVATRAGLFARRQAIEIVHELGATDGYIAGRFARRASGLAALGGLTGAFAAMPVLIGLANLAAPFAAMDPAGATGSADLHGQGTLWSLVAALPPSLWLMLPGLPAFAASIGFLTAQVTVRRWLRRLP